MTQSWHDNAEITTGLILDGRLNIHLVRPEIFPEPYDKLIEVLQAGGALKDVVEKVGMLPVQTAKEASANLNGLGESINWADLLEKSYYQHDVGGKLEAFGRKLQQGKEVSLDKIQEQLTRLVDGHGEMTSLADIEPAKVPFIKTGWQPIDSHLGGIPKVGLITVAGSPGVGKTSWLIKLASHFVKKHTDKRVVIFTLEMILSEFAERFLEVDGTLSEEEKGRIQVCDEVLSIGELCNRAATIKDVGLIGIDFADLLVRGEMSESLMAEVYKSLAALAKNLKVPVILLAQFSRNYGGGIPRPFHVRYTSMSEALSWMIIMLYAPDRDFYAEEEESGKGKKKDSLLPITPGKAYMLCWKCRGGFRQHDGPGAIQVNWMGETAWSDNKGTWFTLMKGM